MKVVFAFGTNRAPVTDPIAHLRTLSALNLRNHSRELISLKEASAADERIFR